MGEIFQYPQKLSTVDTVSEPPHHVQYGDGNGGGNDMLERVKKLEEQVSDLVVNVAVIKSNYATKQDVESVKSALYQAISSQTKWLVASIFVALGAALTVAKLIF